MEVKVPENNQELQEMISDKSYKVRVQVAKSLLATENMLRILSCDRTECVRKEVAKNPNTPIDGLIEVIARGGCLDWEIDRLNELDEKTLDKISDDERFAVKLFVSQHPNSSPKTLEKLSTYRHSLMRLCLARNPKTPSRVLSELAKEEISEIREAVAKNQNTTTKCLERLAYDRTRYVLRAVENNPNCNEKIKKIIADRYFNYEATGIW